MFVDADDEMSKPCAAIGRPGARDLEPDFKNGVAAIVGGQVGAHQVEAAVVVVQEFVDPLTERGQQGRPIANGVDAFVLTGNGDEMFGLVRRNLIQCRDRVLDVIAIDSDGGLHAEFDAIGLKCLGRHPFDSTHDRHFPPQIRPHRNCRDSALGLVPMKVVLLHSGGLDSTVLLYHLRHGGDEVCCLRVDYGQRHSRELDAARSVCDALDVEHRCVDLSSLTLLLAGSALTGDVPVPMAPYDAETLKTTVVPNRNMILLSIATAWAVSMKFDAVAYAAHGGDHEIYPDCRPVFAEAMDRAMQLCDWHPVRLLPSFVGKTKADLVTIGNALGVPFDKTWSCYQGGDVHCGACGTCVERREAFRTAGVADPTQYARARRG